MVSTSSDLKVELNDVQPCVKKLQIEIPAQILAAESDKKLREVSKHAQVQGFRKGHVPKTILQKMYSKSVLWDVGQQLISSGYEAALKEHHLNVYGDPVIENVKVEDGKPLSFTATVETIPEVKIPDYAGWKFTREVIKVSDDVVKKVMESLKEQGAELVPADDRPLKEDDFVFIDFTGTHDGKPIENLSGKNRELTVSTSEKNLLVEFNKKIIGLKKDEEKKFDVTLPKHFPDPALAGKKVHFKVKINSIKEKKLPEITDAFVSAQTSYKTISEMKEKITQNAEEEEQRRADAKLREKIMERLKKETSFDLPPKMLGEYSQHYANNMIARSKQYGIDMESTPNFNKAEFEKNCMEKGEGMARDELIINTIAGNEKIAPDQGEVLKLQKEYAVMFQTGKKEDTKKIQRNAFIAATREVLTNSVYDKIISSLNITDKTVDAKESAEKTGKKTQKVKKQNKESK